MQFLADLLAPLLITPVVIFLLRPLVMIVFRIAVAVIQLFVVGAVVLTLAAMLWLGSMVTTSHHAGTPAVHPRTSATKLLTGQ